MVSLRQQIGYVDGCVQLFNRTVAENIAYGDNINQVTMSRITEVAKQLHMHNFFCSLPDVIKKTYMYYMAIFVYVLFFNVE